MVSESCGQGDPWELKQDTDLAVAAMWVIDIAVSPREPERA